MARIAPFDGSISRALGLITLLAVAMSLAGAAPGEAAFQPGSNGVIAFQRFAGGNSDIWTMGADGSNPVNLTPDSPAMDTDPAFSPDGTQIAFHRVDGGDDDVFVMGADGSNPTNLTALSAASESDPAFSPDGATIAYVFNGVDIFVMPAAGGTPTDLTPGAPTGEAPTYSPDGTRIAFNRFGGGDWDVFAMDAADGGNVTNLTPTGAAFDGGPAYSPGGSLIAFHSDRDGPLDVFTMAAGGGPATNLTPGAPFEQQPAFSPDGTQIAFGSGVGMGLTDLYTMGADGSNPVNRTETGALGEGAPDWQRLEPPDTDPPETEITKGPKKKTKKRKAKFEFAADEPDSTFQCKLDKGDFEPCDPAVTFKVKRKKHTLEVRAVDAAGNVDATPATDSWKVKKKK